MGKVLLDLGGDRLPNRLHQQKNPAKKAGRISSLLRARVTGSSTQTDTPSLVSVAVSQGLIRSATHSATDQQLTPPESAGNAKVAKKGEGVSNVAGGGNRKIGFRAHKIFDKCAPRRRLFRTRRKTGRSRLMVR